MPNMFETPIILPKIEKGIPVWPRRKGFPILDLMQPGDSVLLVGVENDQISSLLANKRKCNGKAFVTRKDGNDLRVRRTA